eukprot:m.256429 g.256429  ORF g.256429 m.256429 type:complete len:1683 (+) comp11017_c1_seq14:3240-8288(+)
MAARQGYTVRLPGGATARFKRPEHITADALTRLAGAPVIELVDSDDFHFPLRDGVYFSESDGAGTTLTAVLERAEPADTASLGLSNIDLARAHLCVNAIRESDPIAALRQAAESGVSADIGAVALSRPEAFARYAIAVSSDAVTVTVAEPENAARMLRDAVPVSFEGGHAPAALLRYAAYLPMSTLLDMCQGVCTALNEMEQAFEVVDIPDDVAASGSTSSSPSTVDDISTCEPDMRRLVFCGHGLGGSIAQLAAILARRTCETRHLPVNVVAVSWAAPFCVDSAVADQLYEQGHRDKHINICSAGDAALAAMNLAMRVGAAKTIMEDRVFEIDKFCDAVAALAAPATQRHEEALNTFKGLSPLARDVADSCFNSVEHGALCMQPHGVWLFIDARQKKLTSFKHQEDIVATLERTEPTLYRFRAHTKLAWLSKLEEGAEFAFLQPDLVVLSSMGPVVEDCHLVCSEDHIELVIEGANLETVLQRLEAGGVALTAGNPSGPLVLSDPEDPGLDLPDTASVFVARASGAELRLFLLGAKFLKPFEFRIRNDFGNSEPYRVDSDKVKHTEGVSPLALLHGTVDPEIFRSVFLRGILGAVSPNWTTEGDEAAMLDTLYELEKLMLGTEDLKGIATNYMERTPDHVTFSIAPATKVIMKLCDAFGKPLRIECDGKIRRFFRKSLGYMGTVVGCVLTVAAGVALLPAAIFAIPAYIAQNHDNRAAAGILGSAGMLLAVPGALVGGLGVWMYERGTRAIRDERMLVYLTLLKLLLKLVDGNPSVVIEEVTQLEDAICKHFSDIRGKSLETASPEEIRESLLAICSAADKAHPCQLFKRSVSRSKAQIVKWLAVVGRLHKIRRILSANLVVAVVGVHNAGKSTLINKLFGATTNANALERTEAPELHRLTGRPEVSESSTDDAPTESDEDAPANCLHVDIADLPGSTDERAHVATIASRVAEIATMFVCVFTAGHIAGPERELMKMVLAKEKDFIVLINKCELLGDDLRTREVEYRENYARVLGVPPECIFFTSMRDPRRIESVRCLLFTHLKFFAKPAQVNEIAMKLQHPTVLKELEAIRVGYGVDHATMASATASILRANLEVTEENIQRVLAARTLSASASERPSARFSDLTTNLSAFATDFLDYFQSLGYDRKLAAVVLSVLSPDSPAAQKTEWTPDVLGVVVRIARDAGRPTDEVIATPSTLKNSLFLTTLLLLQEARVLYDHFVVDNEPRVVLKALQKSLNEGKLTQSSVAEQLYTLVHTNEAVIAAKTAAPLLAGHELLSMLKHSARVFFSKTGAVRPHSVYPTFRPEMSLEERVELFHGKLKEQRENVEGIGMVVESGDVLLSLLANVASMTREQLRSSNIVISLTDSPAIDAAGVLRSCFQMAAEQIRRGEMRLFKVNDETGEVSFSPHAAHDSSTPALMRAFGRLMGVVLVSHGKSVLLPANFALSVFKPLLAQPLVLDDLAEYVARSVKQICVMSDEDVDSLDLSFSVPIENSTEEFELVENGINLAVTHKNKLQYLEQLVRFHLGETLPMTQFILGVQDVCPGELLSIFTASMLQILVCGQETFSVEDLKEFTQISESSPDPQVLAWFWSLVGEMTDSDKALLLTFVTGSSHLPIGGFAALSHAITISHGSALPVDGLPMAQTCFNVLVLPKYTSEDMFRKQFMLALRTVSAVEFGFA